MAQYTGKHSNDSAVACKLIIRDGFISFNDREETRRYRIPTGQPVYEVGADWTGAAWEKLHYNGESFYDHTIIGAGRLMWERVVIQTWDRRTYFVDGRQEVKRVGRGRNAYYPRSSSTETTIIDMDDASAARMADLFERVKRGESVAV